MFISPEVQKFLALRKEQHSPPLESQTVEELRLTSLKTGPVFGGPVIPMASTQDLVAPGPLGDIPLRLYRPTGAMTENAPALIYIHGGGWVIGSIETHDRICRQIASRSDCVVISVEYRLAPEHKAPACTDDCLSAFHWIYKNASALGIDSQRLAVGGDSAGGSLSAVTAIEARDKKIPLRAQVLIYPSVDIRLPLRNYASRSGNGSIPPLTKEALTYFLDKYIDDEKKADTWLTSPIIVDTLEGVAPALLLTGSLDTLHDEGVEYANRLEAANVPIIHRNFPGMIHGFIELSGILTAAVQAFDTIAFFLKEQLQERKTDI
ncbi:alpha/beta hydrolase fold domain-containing protein [Saccharibacter sp. 17.LH.SD]|uniref:alpha/beta hydrolase n=1 Tax=Saccharibacter sp. 17.LH.SD TaxID=2689393 RepID=UPI00136B065C|nr:alpha/beta hydrolase [Saccharibacter sp. 17.LH.SD]MXV43875.1 alpha/beta hydrolase fold domain-containing protein [Saccharibacter sp. 17.LH.SD]